MCCVYIQLHALSQRTQRRLYRVSGIYPTSNTSTAKQTKTVPCVGYISNFKYFHSETNEDCTVCRVYIQLQTLPQRNKRSLYRVSGIYPTSNTSTTKIPRTVLCVVYIYILFSRMWFQNEDPKEKSRSHGRKKTRSPLCILQNCIQIISN